MRKMSRKDIHTMIDIIGEHIERYWIMMLIILGLVACFAIGFMISWNLSPDTVDQAHEVGYYIAQSGLLIITLGCIAALFLGKASRIKLRTVTIIFHIYSFVLMAFATATFIFDLSLGFPEIIYLLIYTIIAGLFVVEPTFYSVCAGLSLITLIIIALAKPSMLFGGNLVIENIINIVAFVLTVVTITFRNYRVTMSEFKQAKQLEELSYVDELTGLLNERSYIDAVEELDDAIKNGEDIKYAVILMDVNNLKATNDAYGHRYGCHLIVRCGHLLPEVFKSSKLFHIGGDEFIAIVLGEDLDNFDILMEEFKKTFDYSLIEFDGHELIFSVAHGIGFYQKGDKFQDVLQRADQEMYVNKKALKEKYGMKSR